MQSMRIYTAVENRAYTSLPSLETHLMRETSGSIVWPAESGLRTPNTSVASATVCPVDMTVSSTDLQHIPTLGFHALRDIYKTSLAYIGLRTRSVRSCLKKRAEPFGIDSSAASSQA